MSAWLGQAVHLAAVTSPSPSPSPGQGSGTTAVQVWTLIVAGLAVVATLVTAFFARRTGKGQVEAAKQAADASERSAGAAQEAVGVNRETAAGVAVRAEADALAKRYQDAAEQLGHEKAPVRLAGVYTMARLADDWSEQRQTCIDVLCAYLRMPWSPDEGNPKQASGDNQVRRTILYVIEQHTQREASISWSDNRFDLRDAILPAFEMEKATFCNELLLNRARFTGHSVLADITFEDGASFAQARIEGSLIVNDLVVNDGVLDFSRVVMAKDALSVRSRFIGPQAEMWLDEITCDGSLVVHLLPASAPQGTVGADGVRVGQTGMVIIDNQPLGDIAPKSDASFDVKLVLRRWRVANTNRLKLPPDVDTDSFTWA